LNLKEWLASAATAKAVVAIVEEKKSRDNSSRNQKRGDKSLYI
jgi:hypothetical protein